MENDLKLQDFDLWVKIFILKHEGENLSKESKISGHPIVHMPTSPPGVSKYIVDLSYNNEVKMFNQNVPLSVRSKGHFLGP